MTSALPVARAARLRKSGLADPLFQSTCHALHNGGLRHNGAMLPLTCDRFRPRFRSPYRCPLRLPLPLRLPWRHSVGSAASAVWLTLRIAVAIGIVGTGGMAAAQDRPVYRCPGPPVLYTDAITPAEARQRDCRTIEGATVTIVPATRARSAPTAAAGAGAGSAAAAASVRGAADSRIDPAEQRARDSDARRILSDELRREEERLAELRREYNDGQPERQGNERNYQKYLDRVAELKQALARREGDVAAIRRELSKLPQ